MNRLFKNDPSTPLGWTLAILFILLALLVLCLWFNSRYPNMSLLGDVSSLSFTVFAIFLISVMVRSYYRKDWFTARVTLIEAFLGVDGSRTRETASLFTHTLHVTILALAGILVAVGLAWTVHLLGPTGSVLAIVAECVILIWSVNGLKERLVSVVLLVGVPTLLAIQGEHYVSALGAGFIGGAILCNRLYRSEKARESIKRDSNTLSAFVWKVKSVGDLAAAAIYDLDTKRAFQGLVVSVAVITYFVGEKATVVLPPELGTKLATTENGFAQVRAALPYLVCAAYSAFTLAPLASTLVKPFQTQHESNPFKTLYNFLVAFIVICLLGPLMFIPVLLMLACLFLAGEFLFGSDFALVVGFFVFPEWSTKSYSVFLVLLLFVLPQKLLKRWTVTPANICD